MTPHEIASRLDPDEQVLWWGHPPRKPAGEPWETARVAMGLMIAAPFVLIGLVGLIAGGLSSAAASLVPMAIGTAIVLAAYAGAAAREGRAQHALYAITSQRVLFLDWRWPQGRVVRQIPLTQTLYPTIRRGSEGTGTISFRPHVPGREWGGVRSHEPFAFINIPEPQAVYDLYVRVATAAQQAEWRGTPGQTRPTAG